LAPDIDGTVTTAGHNLIGNNRGNTGLFPVGMPNAAQDWVGTAASPLLPRLGPLRENGGPTRTLALSGSSPALDNAMVLDPSNRDQRGNLRGSTTQDIGAYELVPETYTYWSAHEFAPGSTVASALSDADGDGALNSLEYATGSDPNSGTSRPVLTVGTSGNQWTIDFLSSPLAANALQLEISSNLRTWVSSNTTQFIGYDLSTGLRKMRFTETRSVPARFARLKALVTP
jgi:hypothetical protein